MPGMKETMKEWKAGKLHSGSKKGPVVKSQKQAEAIAFSEERAAKGKPAVRSGDLIRRALKVHTSKRGK